jgi:hypothetical protein
VFEYRIVFWESLHRSEERLYCMMIMTFLVFIFLALHRRHGMIVWRLECGVFHSPVRWIEFYWASLRAEPVCVLL